MGLARESFNYARRGPRRVAEAGDVRCMVWLGVRRGELHGEFFSHGYVSQARPGSARRDEGSSRPCGIFVKRFKIDAGDASSHMGSIN
jgi:hypothetical protein